MSNNKQAPASPEVDSGRDPIIGVRQLGFTWPTLDPFLFCAHHNDAYPEGNEVQGPDPSLLAGRNMGQDFEIKDGWRMYHGDKVPGFPQHPHRGFETVTLVRQGLLDHSDSLGAAARFGGGDVQWLTAGAGILHSEMFPLINADKGNHVELFQVWLNLPRDSKFVPAHFSMLWADTLPVHHFKNEAGKTTTVTTIAGTIEGKAPPAPPPSSWAAQPNSEVAIWTVKMEPGASWTLPAAKPGLNRMLYFFEGSELRVGGRTLPKYHGAQLRSELPTHLQNGPEATEILVLQGRPIGEPVFQHGPFVMNTREEIVQTINDYQRTRFGGWPWPSDEPVHPREEGRFARHADGKIERPS